MRILWSCPPLYCLASDRAFFRKETSDESFSMDVSTICRPDPLSEASGSSERGSGRQIVETSIENGSSEAAFLKKALSEATQYGYR